MAAHSLTLHELENDFPRFDWMKFWVVDDRKVREGGAGRRDLGKQARRMNGLTHSCSKDRKTSVLLNHFLLPLVWPYFYSFPTLAHFLSLSRSQHKGNIFNTKLASLPFTFAGILDILLRSSGSDPLQHSGSNRFLRVFTHVDSLVWIQMNKCSRVPQEQSPAAQLSVGLLACGCGVKPQFKLFCYVCFFISTGEILTSLPLLPASPHLCRYLCSDVKISVFEETLLTLLDVKSKHFMFRVVELRP